MADENEPAKLLLPYLQRADELQKHEPLVAYYCRLYAMESGLKIPSSGRTKTTNALLISIMNQLEKDKKSLKLGPDDHLHLEGFALNVFVKADKQDRAGRTDLNTAKTFYAASIFFEILNQFGELQPDLEQKQKYAAWKAADIRKALKEGRKPVPGPPGGDKDLLVPSRTRSGEYDINESITDPGIRPAPESDSSSQLYDKVNESVNVSLPSNIPSSQSLNVPTSPSYPSDDYPVHNYYQAPKNRLENSSYSQAFHHQTYQQDPQQQLPQPYPSHDASCSYPNFQSYPSFSEGSLPGAQSQYPSYYQGSGASYPTSLAPNAVNSQSSTRYGFSGRNDSISKAVPTSAEKYHYDGNYLPSPEKIAEAHKAARLQLALWHLMMYLLQWITLRNHSNY